MRVAIGWGQPVPQPVDVPVATGEYVCATGGAKRHFKNSGRCKRDNIDDPSWSMMPLLRADRAFFSTACYDVDAADGLHALLN